MKDGWPSVGKSRTRTTWVFYLNKNYKFNDGIRGHRRRRGPFDDESGHQRPAVEAEGFGGGRSSKAEAADKFTRKIHHEQTYRAAVGFLCDRLIVTSKAPFDKYGRDVADKEHMMGGRPYRLKELIPGQRMVMQSSGRIIPRPKKIRGRRMRSIYRVMRETGTTRHRIAK